LQAGVQRLEGFGVPLFQTFAEFAKALEQALLQLVDGLLLALLRASQLLEQRLLALGLLIPQVAVEPANDVLGSSGPLAKLGRERIGALAGPRSS
jgi:hypothetical protein